MGNGQIERLLISCDQNVILEVATPHDEVTVESWWREKKKDAAQTHRVPLSTKEALKVLFVTLCGRTPSRPISAFFVHQPLISVSAWKNSFSDLHASPTVHFSSLGSDEHLTSSLTEQDSPSAFLAFGNQKVNFVVSKEELFEFAIDLVQCLHRGRQMCCTVRICLEEVEDMSANSVS